MAKVHQAITSIQFPSRTDWASSKSVLMLSTGRGRQMAQGKGSDCETEPRLPPDASHKCRLSPVLLTSRLWTGECRPSLRGDEFARVAHRTQRNIYRFPTEGCHSETGGKKLRARSIGRSLELCCLWVSVRLPAPHLFTYQGVL